MLSSLLSTSNTIMCSLYVMFTVCIKKYSIAFLRTSTTLIVYAYQCKIVV